MIRAQDFIRSAEVTAPDTPSFYDALLTDCEGPRLHDIDRIPSASDSVRSSPTPCQHRPRFVMVGFFVLSTDRNGAGGWTTRRPSVRRGHRALRRDWSRPAGARGGRKIRPRGIPRPVPGCTIQVSSFRPRGDPTSRFRRPSTGAWDRPDQSTLASDRRLNGLRPSHARHGESVRPRCGGLTGAAMGGGRRAGVVIMAAPGGATGTMKSAPHRPLTAAVGTNRLQRCRARRDQNINPTVSR